MCLGTRKLCSSHAHRARGFPSPLPPHHHPFQVRELQDPNLVVRQKALLAARELLAVPINHVQCIAAGITPAIVALLAVRA